MSGPQIIKTLPMGKGVLLHIFRDNSQAPTSPDRWHTEVVASGEGEPLSVPMHWHRTHTEIIAVHEGRVEATINGVKRVVSAGESIEIPVYAVHALQGFKGERLVVTERANPAGDYKVEFFDDLLAEGWPAPFWHTMRAFYDGDGYPALGLHFKFLDMAFVTILGGIAKLMLPAKQKLEG